MSSPAGAKSECQNHHKRGQLRVPFPTISFPADLRPRNEHCIQPGATHCIRLAVATPEDRKTQTSVQMVVPKLHQPGSRLLDSRRSRRHDYRRTTNDTDHSTTETRQPSSPPSPRVTARTGRPTLAVQLWSRIDCARAVKSASASRSPCTRPGLFSIQSCVYSRVTARRVSSSCTRR